MPENIERIHPGELIKRMFEIERKFLVTSEAYKDTASKKCRIVQGFLNTHPERTVRVRTMDAKGFLTVKGISNEAGTSRFEWEREISLKEAEELLKLCEPGVIEKVRFEVKSGEHLVEVDEFIGENYGLVLAEIELSEENELFIKPPWLGIEVTGDIRYYNSQLSKNPYKNWDNED